MNRLLSIFANRRMAALLLLGFGSGLPLALTGGTLQAWMKALEIDLTTIGLFQLVTLPYVLKFAWAPLMDRYAPPLLGRRRGWLIVTQFLLLGAIVLLALRGQHAATGGLFALAMLVALLSASQDIVADAYRTDVLAPEERGVGAAWFVTGYRIAMVASGAGAFILVGQGWTNWPVAYLLMGAGMMIGVAGTLVAPEPKSAIPPPESLYDAIVPPFREFVARGNGWIVLAFVLLFRLPDTVAGTMTVPFLLDIGVSNTQIGVIRNGFGVGMTIVGALVGGAIVTQLGLRRSLWIAGILQAVSNGGFWILANAGGNHTPTLLAVMFVENFCGGLAVAAFFAFLMSQCSPDHSATQYALLSSLMALAGTLIGSQTGAWAQALGWNAFFAISVIAAVPGMALLFWLDFAETSSRQGFEVSVSDEVSTLVDKQ